MMVKSPSKSHSPQLSPAQNSQKYFKKYQKLKNAVAHIEQQLALTKAEIAYLESVQMQLELAQPSDLNDIELELQTAGYLTQNQAKQKKRKPKKLKQTRNLLLLLMGLRSQLGKIICKMIVCR